MSIYSLKVRIPQHVLQTEFCAVYCTCFELRPRARVVQRTDGWSGEGGGDRRKPEERTRKQAKAMTPRLSVPGSSLYVSLSESLKMTDVT